MICDVIIGATPARKVSAYWGGDNPWVKIGELDGGVIRDTAERISDEGVARSPSKLIPAGTLLFSFKLSIGKTAVTGVDLYTNEAIAALPVKDERVVMRDFLHYYLKSHSHIQGAEVAAKGALLNSHKVAQISVPLPSPSEQRRIVEILDQADAIRKKRAEADKLAERILPALFYDMFGDPATNPKGWSRTTLQAAGARVRYGLGQPPASAEGGLPLIRATNVNRGTVSDEDMIFVARDAVPVGRNAFLAADDIIVVRSGAYTGDIAQVTDKWAGSVAGYDLVVKPGSRLRPEYLESYMLTPCIQKGYFSGLKSRAGQPHLNETQVSDMPVLVPPDGLQLRYARATAGIRTLRVAAAKTRDSIETLHRTMLHRAFSGELTAKWREKNKALVESEMAEQKKILNMTKEG